MLRPTFARCTALAVVATLVKSADGKKPLGLVDWPKGQSNANHHYTTITTYLYAPSNTTSITGNATITESADNSEPTLSDGIDWSVNCFDIINFTSHP
jgi:hypothetical protein